MSYYGIVYVYLVPSNKLVMKKRNRSEKRFVPLFDCFCDPRLDSLNCCYLSYRFVFSLNSKASRLLRPLYPWTLGSFLVSSLEKLNLKYGHHKCDLLSNEEMKTSRKHNVCEIIVNNVNNSKFPFSIKLVNPPRSIPALLHSSEKCNDFALYFKYKMSNIRNNIVASTALGCHCTSSTLLTLKFLTLSNFSPICHCKLHEVV